MNKEYIHYNGKVIVSDENGIKKPMNYSKNVEEILITENIIEVIKDKLIKNEIDFKFNQLSKDATKSLVPIPVLTFGIGSLVIPSFFIPLISDNLVQATRIGSMRTSTMNTIVLTPIMTLLGGLISLSIYSQYKEEAKKTRGNESSILYLKKRLENEKEKLNGLKTKENLENICIIEDDSLSKRVNDEEQLRELNYHICCYYQCGYKEKQYLRYLAKGTLRQILYKKGYSIDRIALIEDYTKNVQREEITSKEKARTLVRNQSKQLKG